jgi:hypothetical protein
VLCRHQWQHAPWHALCRAPCQTCLLPSTATAIAAAVSLSAGRGGAPRGRWQRGLAGLAGLRANDCLCGKGVLMYGGREKCSELLLTLTTNVCAPLPDPLGLNRNALRTRQPT